MVDGLLHRTVIKVYNYSNHEFLEGSLPDVLELYGGRLVAKWDTRINVTDSDSKEVKEKRYKGVKFLLREHCIGSSCFYDNELETYCCEVLCTYGTFYTFTLSSFGEAHTMKGVIEQWLMGNLIKSEI